MSRVLALVSSTLVLNGWVALGQAEARMGEHSRATGVVSHTDPITMRVSVVDERGAIHD